MSWNHAGRVPSDQDTDNVQPLRAGKHQRATRTSGGRWRLAVTVLVAAAALAACTVPQPPPSWPQFRHDAGGSGVAPNETAISPSNVASLVADYEADLGTGVNASGVIPTVAGGRVYVVVGKKLLVFDASGVSQCSSGSYPKTCLPLFTAALFGDFQDTAPAVVNGFVYVSTLNDDVPNTHLGKLEVFSANGTTNCSGTPKVCTPLWTSADYTETIYGPIVANGFVYTTDATAHLAAFDANGNTNCSGTPKTCSPVWTSSVLLGLAKAAADGQHLVAIGWMSTPLYAFDPLGQVGCGGTPRTCDPLWSADVGSGPNSYPTLAGGRAYVPNNNALWVFDADGSDGCSGTPSACMPLWKGSGTEAVGGASGGPAVTSDRVYTTNHAFSTDPAGCPGSTPTCAPLWTTWEQGVLQPAVANGVLFTAGTAYDISAPPSCGGQGGPAACPLPGYDGGQYTAIVNGRVFTARASPSTPGNATLTAYRLP